MKRTMIGAAVGLVLAATTINAFGAQFTMENAKAAALEHAGVSENDARYIKAELDREDGRQVYEVEFMTNDYIEYEYTLDAETGSIIDIDCDKEDAFYQGTDNGKNGGRKGANYKDGDGKSAANSTTSITIEKAKSIAAAHAGKTEENLDFTKTKTDRDDGRTVYEIEFYTSANEKYEYEIDAASGTILQWEYETRRR